MEERDEKKGRKEMEEGNEKEMEEKNDGQRKKAIDRVTIGGSIVNGVLLIFKFVAGVLGGSAAMIADAVHSLSDFVTDLVVLVFIRLSGKPQDKGHDYGHGKYETLATALIGGMLLAVGVIVYGYVNDRRAKQMQAEMMEEVSQSAAAREAAAESVAE